MKCAYTGFSWEYLTCQSWINKYISGRIWGLVVRTVEPWPLICTQWRKWCECKERKSPGLSICVPSRTLWLRDCLCRTRGGMNMAELKSERSHSLHRSQSHTEKGGAWELHESKIRFPLPLFSSRLVRGYSPGVSIYWPLQRLGHGTNPTFSRSLNILKVFPFNPISNLINRWKCKLRKRTKRD